ncbi:MAG: alanine racemase [Solirubrobacteraceae bacterium]
MSLRALARVNVAAIERNVARLRRELQGAAELCAVVKADGYGHGAAPAARAALDGGATWIAVATAQEADALRRAGIEGRMLIMGAISSDELADALHAQADLVAWDERFVDAVAAAARGRGRPIRLHVNLDTGMGRLGTRDCGQALAVAERIAQEEPGLQLAGAMTHFATADEDLEFLARQLARFGPFVGELRRHYPAITVHAANSAAVLRAPQAHFDLVRCGIAIYGCDPMGEDPSLRELEPALELTSYVAAVKRAQPGDSVGYGRRFTAREPTRIATVPIGYGDGVRRAFSDNCELLIGGGRYPLVGAVSMDNVTLDVGRQAGVAPGDGVTLIGTDGGQRQTAEELARLMATINYEILCGISSRVPRQYHRDGEPKP